MVENGKISDCAGRCKNSIFRSCDMLYYSFMDQSPEKAAGLSVSAYIYKVVQEDMEKGGTV